MTSSLSFGSFGSGRGFLAAGEKAVRLGRPDSGCLRFKPPQRQAVKACLIANPQQKSLNPFLSLKEESCKRKEELPIYPETLDEWMNESITEIVRNLGDAPLLVDIYSKKGTARTRIEKEKAKDSWPLIRRRWKEESCVPDGLILVEQLKDEDDEIVDESGSRSWGIVIQGRGLDCSACYILKTNRVRSTVGFCTYFCLVRAKCFGETAALQLRNSWLL